SAGGVLAQCQNDSQLAIDLIEDGLSLTRGTGDKAATADLTRLLAVTLLKQKQNEKARPLLEEALGTYQDLGPSWQVAATLNDLFCVTAQSGDYKTSIAFAQRSLTLFEELKDKRCVAMAANNIAHSLIKMDRFEEAPSFLKRSILLAQELRDTRWILGCFETFAGLACGRRQFGNVVVLLSLDDALRAQGNSPRQPLDAPDYEGAMGAARSALNPDDFQAAREKGQAMTIEEGVAYVL